MTLESTIRDMQVITEASKYDLYHKDFSTAMQHAYKMAKKLHGITVDPKEIDDKVASGPRKPSEGKTNSYRLKGDKGAIQVQVYNKGGNKPFELNFYKEEVEIDEARQLKDPKKEVMVSKGGKVIVIDKKDQDKYLKKGWELAEDDEKETEKKAKKDEAETTGKEKVEINPEVTESAASDASRDIKKDKDLGRRKDSADDDDEASPQDRTKLDTRNVIMQLKKAADNKNHKVKFDDGKSIRLKPEVVKAALVKFSKLKSNEKEKVQAQMQKSYKDMIKALSSIKEEVDLDEAKMSASQIAALKKAYEPMRDKRINTSDGNKLSAMMDKVGKDKEALIQLFKADIPFVSQSAATKLITKHNMKGAEINKLREEADLDESTYRVGGFYVERGDEKPVSMKFTANSPEEAKKKAIARLSKDHPKYRAGKVTKVESVDLDEAFSDIFAEETFQEELFALNEDDLNEYLEGLDEEEFVALEEFINEAPAGDFAKKLAKGAGKLIAKGAKAGAKRLSTQGKADAADKKAAKLDAKAANKERLVKANERIQAAKERIKKLKDKAREAKTPEAKKAVADSIAKAKESGKKAVDAKKDAAAAATEQKENYSMERMGVSKDLVNSVRDVLMGKRPVEVDEGDKEEYEKFFQAALKKFGVGSPSEFKSDEEKKKFFDYIEKKWTKDEK